MTRDKIKKVMDACYLAKRARDLLPKLPNGVTPSHIHYLDTIRKLELKTDHIKVSDISDELGLPRPSVTKTIKDMESLGFVVGAIVTVVSENAGNLIVNIKESRVAIDKTMANKIMV